MGWASGRRGVAKPTDELYGSGIVIDQIASQIRTRHDLICGFDCLPVSRHAIGRRCSP
jgi:hypothetical protein